MTKEEKDTYSEEHEHLTKLLQSIVKELESSRSASAATAATWLLTLVVGSGITKEQWLDLAGKIYDSTDYTWIHNGLRKQSDQHVAEMLEALCFDDRQFLS